MTGAEITVRPEPLVITVRRFVCPFCHRGHSRPSAAREHIARCFRNPDAHGCKTCDLFAVDRSEPEVGYVGGEWCGAVSGYLDALRTNCPSWMPKVGEVR